MTKKSKLIYFTLAILLLPGLLLAELNPKTIDDFERPNPATIYRVETQDESTLTISTTKRAKEGSDAMQLEYNLKTSRAYGSAVLVRCEPEYNDWTKYDQLWIWVKGDGSGNIFRIFFTDASDEVWEYQDREILLSQKWQLLKVDFNEFTLTTLGEVNNREIEKGEIKDYGFGFIGRTPDSSRGIISLDEFAGAGPSIKATRKRPEAPKVQMTYGFTADSNWRHTPENGEEMYHSFNFKINGDVGDFSALAEISPVFQEFGESAADDRLDNRTGTWSPTGTTSSQFMKVEIPNFQMAMRNLGFLDLVQVGNQWLDYSKYTYSPEWGYKGISVDSAGKGYGYNVFYLKHRYGSYTSGTRIDYDIWGFKNRGIVVYSYDSAKRNSEVVGTTIDSSPNDLQTEKIGQDTVFTYEVSRQLWKKFILRGRVGADIYKSEAEVDRTDPYNPIYLRAKDSPVSEQGNFWTGGLDINGLWAGANINFEYRNMDDHFLPRWRFDRKNFDNDNGNQKSYNVNASQELFDFILSGGYLDLKRIANVDYYRYSSRWEIGHKAYNGIEIYFGKEYLNDYNYHTDDRYGFSTYRNFKVTITNLYVASRLSNKTNIYTKYSLWNGWDRGLEETISNHSLSLRGEHYFLKNIVLTMEYTHTQYSHLGDEPTGTPYDDNRTLATLKMYF